MIFAALACAAALADAGAIQTQPVQDGSQVRPPMQSFPDYGATPPSLSTTPSGQFPAARPRAGNDAISTEFPPEAAGKPGKAQGRYYVSRWAEDWSFLRDPSKANDPFDLLKFIPLNHDKSIWLTLSNDTRVGYYSYDNPALNPKAKPVNAALFKSIVGASLNFTDHVQFYGELATADVGGSGFHPILAYERSTLYVQQAFVKFSGHAAGAEVGAMVGRQEFTDGPQQIVSIRDVPNLHYEFNGVRAYANWSMFRADAFDFRSMRFGPQVFNSNTNWDEQLYGVTSSVVIPRFSNVKLFMDPFYFGYTNLAKTWGTTTGKDDLSIYGARLWGDIGPRIKIDWMADIQSGSYNHRDVQAFTIYTNQSVLLMDNRYRPTLGVRVDEASGGGAFSKTGTLHDADYFFGKAPYFSDGLLVVGQNIIDAAPNISFRPIDPLSLSAEAEMLWRYNDFDSIYPSSKVPYAGVQNVRGYHVGTLYRLKGIWQINTHLAASTAIEFLDAGQALTRAHLGDTLFTGEYLNFRF